MIAPRNLEPRKAGEDIMRRSLMDLALPPAWYEDAICSQYDPTLFFPKRTESNHAAKAICAKCPVQMKCLNYALDNNETAGVWGGHSFSSSKRPRRAA